ncbi:MAG: leucine-rich repeat domain-containing protein, partial [Acholeplasmatales bacterium]|nr:leucine-rich repeat domain-containing protein [Acholeplasmatales bacterium]
SNGESLLSVTGFSYGLDEVITIILPKYVYINGNYEILRSIAIYSKDEELYSPFTALTNIKSIYFNEGFIEIGNNAFKNCTKLTSVYLSSTITSIAKDAFYFAISNTFDDNKELALALTIYKYQGSSLNTSNLLACKWNSSEKYYGQNYKWSITDWGKIDLSNSIKTNNTLLNYLVNGLF